MISTDDIEWRPKDAPSALRALELLGRRLREKGDQRAVFCDIYILITRRVVGIMSADDNAGFIDARWLSLLTGRFAEEALIATLTSLRNTTVRRAAWRFANHYSAHKLAKPCQDAILGVSAHINYDLPIVVYDHLAAEGAALDVDRLKRYRHDYMRVNKILEASIPECLDLLVERYQCPITTRLLQVPLCRPFLCHAVHKTLVAWRDRVWSETLELLHAPNADVRRAIIERMDRRAGRIAQLVCSQSALGLALRGEPPPFRLSRAPHTWPDVDPTRAAERTVTDHVLERAGRQLNPAGWTPAHRQAREPSAGGHGTRTVPS
ncbi:MAG: DUF5995 family protein [Myxococcales bacterium]|nr:DUF5995 family protein [Myxococcales bacterium]